MVTVSFILLDSFQGSQDPFTFRVAANTRAERDTTAESAISAAEHRSGELHFEQLFSYLPDADQQQSGRHAGR